MRMLPLALVLVPLAACTQAPDANQTAADTTTTDPVQGSASGVTRAEVTPTPTATPAPVQAIIATQPASHGAQAELNKVAVTGDVLTVQLTYRGGQSSQVIQLDEVSVIDDASARQLGVLKDNGGKWLAAPLGSNGKQLLVYSANSPAIVWFKFPAPPAESKTVSINIPGTAPFDGVAVTR